MNPAYSVIIFTTASGLGYGMLALLGLVAANHGVASSPAFAITTVLTALSFVTIGLLSSTLHLGHPERAWRALTQWRSSWLSREGIAAVACYPFAIFFGLAWSDLVHAPMLVALLGIATFFMCGLTVVCTAMIYRSLRTIPKWDNNLVVPVYMLFALAAGATTLAAISTLFGRWQIFQAGLSALAIIALLIAKIAYWRSTDAATPRMTTAKATGLGQQVRQWEVPHTSANFIQEEMGYVVARKHRVALRRVVSTLLAFGLGFTLLSFSQLHGLAWLSAICVFTASLVERWLFFAEAQHVAISYYGEGPI